MSFNLIWQYTAVILLIIAGVAWIIWNLRRKDRNKKGGSCAGCSLSSACSDYRSRDGSSPKRDLKGKPSSDNNPRRTCHK